MPSQFKRTQIWVDSAFQFRLLLRLVVYFVLLSATAFHFAFLLEVFRNLSKGFVKSVSVLYLDFLHQQLPILFTAALFAPILLYDLVKFSHRVAGPLFRCRKVMERMADDQVVPEFIPRRHDLLGDFFKSFNALIRVCNARSSHAPKDAEVPAETCPR